MARTYAPITPSVMRWARESARFSLEEAAARLGRPVEDLAGWESGTSEPTIAQARKAAELYRRPFAALFLPEPPKGFSVIPDYRRLSRSVSREYSRELGFMLRDAQERQSWLRNHLIDDEVLPLDFVGSARADMSPDRVANAIRKRLGIGVLDTSRCANQSAALRMWIDRAEDAGIFIFRNGVISSDEACGFALCDSYAPFIFVNSNDSNARQLFSLVHELTHVWFNSSALSNPLHSGFAASSSIEEMEAYCNRVASLALVDPEHFSEAVTSLTPSSNLLDACESIADTFNVSAEVIARRLLDIGNITEEEYNLIRQESTQRWREYVKSREAERARLKEAGKSGGPNIYKTWPNQKGRAFMRTVLSAYAAGQATAAELHGLLGVKVKYVAKFSEILSLPLPSGRARA